MHLIKLTSLGISQACPQTLFSKAFLTSIMLSYAQKNFGVMVRLGPGTKESRRNKVLQHT